MKTRILSANEQSITTAAKLIKNGDLVAFPTETVYGLGANALDEQAVRKIFFAKNRPADNPLIVHVAELATVSLLVKDIPVTAQALIDAFWPGPLSIVFLKSALVPKLTTAGLETVVIRFPSHPTAQALIKAAGTPIAAPSANISGRVSPTTAKDVFRDLDTKIPLILDSEQITYGIESTVIDCTTPTPTLLRPGSITKEMIEEVVGAISDKPTKEVKSPGMKYRHYSPATPLTLLTGSAEERQRKYQEYTDRRNTSFSLIFHSIDHCHETAQRLSSQPKEAAVDLYSTLIKADAHQLSEIVVEGYEDDAQGIAIMNRLRKAATIIK